MVKGAQSFINGKIPYLFWSRAIFCIVTLAVALACLSGCGIIWGSVTYLKGPSTSQVFSASWVGGNNIIDQLGSYGAEYLGSTSNIPGGRYASISWTDQSGNLWLFGGYGYSAAGPFNYLNDLWEYSPSNHRWTWMSGSNTTNQAGNFGPLGASSTLYYPGSRAFSISWTDSSGNLWLFGGQGYDHTGALGGLNDLWMYNPGSQKWTWVSGSNVRNQLGAFGPQGASSTAYVPGARTSSISWTDASGNLWLFGGAGLDGAGTNGDLNDVWMFTPGNQNWTWVSGNEFVWQSGTYGTIGVGSLANIPGARYESISWIDASGNFWLFGGQGEDSVGTVGDLNDLWKFTPSNGQWAWMSGSKTVNSFGMYGNRGVASSINSPGARDFSTSWINGGNLWLFGGHAYDSNGTFGPLNDFWEYSPSTALWTWVAGADLIAQTGVYGSQGVTMTTNIPGSRAASISWSDASGNLWLFGGSGFDSVGASGFLNDFWNFIP